MKKLQTCKDLEDLSHLKDENVKSPEQWFLSCILTQSDEKIRLVRPFVVSFSPEMADETKMWNFLFRVCLISHSWTEKETTSVSYDNKCLVRQR